MARDEMRKYMDTTLQKLSPARAQELARSMMQGQTREQVQRVAKDLLEWSNRGRQRLSQAVQREVRSQLKGLGLAGKEEVDALKRRVRELERELGMGKAPAAKPSTAKRTASKRSTAKRSTAKRTGSQAKG